MIPQGRQCQEAALAAAQKSYGCCSISLGAAPAQRDQPSKGGGRQALPVGMQLIQGGRGTALQGKQTTQLLRTPTIMSMHSPERICRRKRRNINRMMLGWKHHLKMTFHSKMSGQSVSQSDGVLTLGFSITSLLPSTCLLLMASFRAPSLKPHQKEDRGKKGTIYSSIFFSLLFPTSIPVQLLSNLPAVRAIRKQH